MLKLAITWDPDQSEEEIAIVKRRLENRAEVNAVVEVSLERVVKDHLRRNYAGRPNRLGGTSTGYWRRAIDNTVTTASASGTGASLEINQTGVRLKYYGGTIRATGRPSKVTGKPIKYLSIPVHPAAHGRTISDLGGKGSLHFRTFRNGGGGIFRNSDQTLLFVLKKQVIIKPDKNILPPDQTIISEVQKDLYAYFDNG